MRIKLCDMLLGASRSICRFGGSLYVMSAPPEVLWESVEVLIIAKKNYLLCNTVFNEQWSDTKRHVNIAVRILISHRAKEEWDVAFF